MSMSPALVEGDEVLLERASGPFARGQVVVVRRPAGEWVIHRVVAVEQGRIITRGDACPRADPAIPTQAVFLNAIRRKRAGTEQPIPPRRLVSWRRLRWGLARLLGRHRLAPGRFSRERPSCSISPDGR
jgi:signal peptidase I